jgi:prolyl oligopeptidase
MDRKEIRCALRGIFVFCLIAILFVAVQSCKKGIDVPPPPETKVVEAVDTLHGVDIVDPYRWLEDQKSHQTREWIDAQNAYTDSVLGSLSGREELKSLAAKLIKIDTIGIPTERGGRYFLTKRSADQELSVIYMRQGLDGEDKVLIDPHPMSEDKTTNVNIQGISHDGTLLAYGIRRGGEDELEIRFMDVDTMEDLPDALPRGLYFGISMMPDKTGFFYTRMSMVGPRILYHSFGTDISDDKEIFGKGYALGNIMFPLLSDDGRWLIIIVLEGSSGKTEVYLKDLAGEKPITTVVNDLDAWTMAFVVGDTLYIQTNWEAPNGRLLAADPENPSRENWKEIIPESDIVMQGLIAPVTFVGEKIFVNYLKDVKSQVVIFEPDGTRVGEISFPTIGTVGGLSGHWDSNEAFFVFTSYHIPTIIYRYDVATGEKEVWAKIEVPIDSEQYEVKQVWYASKDGTKIPMFIVHKKGIKLDGSNPALLTGYGGFNLSSTPFFSADAVAWIEQGGIYAFANLRGGGEFGEEWHKAGMLANKQNVFDDFIAAAEYLIAEGYTQSKKLAIEGGSNGGLLVGAAVTQRPDLYGAVICTYPLLDMVRYHKFLVARYWVPEYGSSENPEQFKYLHAYSPYHNVVKGTKYPAIFFITGDSDTRVAPLHARKMAALMQASTGSDKPVLLRYHTTAGHSGGQPVSEQIENLAETLSFLLWQLEGKT